MSRIKKFTRLLKKSHYGIRLGSTTRVQGNAMSDLTSFSSEDSAQGGQILTLKISDEAIGSDDFFKSFGKSSTNAKTSNSASF